jgi:methanogenic corrinoid protein MtbC1
LKNGQTDEAKQMTQKALKQGLEPLAIIEEILVPALTEIGEKFQKFEIFLPELMMAGEAAEAITAIVEKATLEAGQPSLNKGTVILGQVEGDMHDIGRNIVGTLLKSHGFKVVDMGRDVPASAFLDAAEKEEADTMSLFSEVRKREEFFIVVGGGAVSEEWAKEIGSDGYSADAAGAVELCKTLMKK